MAHVNEEEGTNLQRQCHFFFSFHSHTTEMDAGCHGTAQPHKSQPTSITLHLMFVRRPVRVLRLTNSAHKTLTGLSVTYRLKELTQAD